MRAGFIRETLGVLTDEHGARGRRTNRAFLALRPARYREKLPHPLDRLPSVPKLELPGALGVRLVPKVLVDDLPKDGRLPAEEPVPRSAPKVGVPDVVVGRTGVARLGVPLSGAVTRGALAPTLEGLDSALVPVEVVPPIGFCVSPWFSSSST
jgi:hypothetical protein